MKTEKPNPMQHQPQEMTPMEYAQMLNQQQISDLADAQAPEDQLLQW